MIDKLFKKAKFDLIRKGSIFLSTITFSVKHLFTDEIPTAGTDGLTIAYNPQWFESLDNEERVGVLAHETWHIALSHIVRLGSRDPEIWNYAGDFVINSLLMESGFKLPKGACYDKVYKDWSTVKVYEDLLLNQKQPPPDFKMDILAPGSITKDPDPNNKGVIPEAAAINKVKGILVKAVTASQLANDKPGNIPGEVSRMVNELINPKLDYDELLHRYMNAHVKDDYSWSKPNKRFLPDFYLPSQHSEALKNITFAVDTSGSISKSDIRKIASEMQYIVDTYKPQKFTALDCDRVIHNIHEITETDFVDITTLKFSGGGGTSFTPVIEYCKKHETNLLIYFTDLHANQITEDPGFPIIWLCYSKHKPAPIGETVYYDPQ